FFNASPGVHVIVDTGSVTQLTTGFRDHQPSWQPGTDRDGDGLWDPWETSGLDADGDGTVDVDLPAMGASPDRKDIFVELDHMTGLGLDQGAIDLVVDAFGAAPVMNLDGSTGISLHVDNGPLSEMDPVTAARWGSRSRADELP